MTKMFKLTTVKVIKVQEKSLPCENISVDIPFDIIGLNGNPIFDCSHSCSFFLSLTTKAPVQRRRKSNNLLLRNLKFRNGDCKSSIINVYRAISLDLEISW